MGRGQRWNPANLRRLRQAFGLSPEAFAERVGSQKWLEQQHGLDEAGVLAQVESLLAS